MAREGAAAAGRAGHLRALGRSPRGDRRRAPLRRPGPGEPRAALGGIEIRYRSAERFADVAFGVAFYCDDGLTCYGSNTALDGVRVAVAEGEGIVRFHARRLELLEGEYLLDVAATSADQKDVYDYHSKGYPFRVSGKTGEIGVVRIAHEWEVGPGPGGLGGPRRAD